MKDKNQPVEADVRALIASWSTVKILACRMSQFFMLSSDLQQQTFLLSMAVNESHKPCQDARTSPWLWQFLFIAGPRPSHKLQKSCGECLRTVDWMDNRSSLRCVGGTNDYILNIAQWCRNIIRSLVERLEDCPKFSENFVCPMLSSSSYFFLEIVAEQWTKSTKRISFYHV